MNGSTVRLLVLRAVEQGAVVVASGALHLWGGVEADRVRAAATVGVVRTCEVARIQLRVARIARLLAPVREHLRVVVVVARQPADGASNDLVVRVGAGQGAARLSLGRVPQVAVLS